MEQVNKLISVLCVEKKSVYKDLVEDCWDEERDMMNFDKKCAIVAHPPCAQWSRMRGLSTDDPYKKGLALKCIEIIRKNGGVLEHPRSSILWRDILPLPGKKDDYNGYSICVKQHWFGHKCDKETLLYIVGVSERELPDIRYSLDAVEYVVGDKKGNGKKPVSKRERSATPPLFAKWLIEVATKIEMKKNEK